MRILSTARLSLAVSLAALACLGVDLGACGSNLADSGLDASPGTSGQDGSISTQSPPGADAAIWSDLDLQQHEPLLEPRRHRRG